jgi:hypothetical protein
MNHLFNEIIKNECRICLNDYDDKIFKPTVLFPCGHTFCSNCISLLNICGLCKSNITFKTTNWDIITNRLAKNKISLSSISIEIFKIIYKEIRPNSTLGSNEESIHEAAKLIKQGYNMKALLILSKIKVYCKDFYIFFLLKGICYFNLNEHDKSLFNLDKILNHYKLCERSNVITLALYYKSIINKIKLI